MNVAKKDIEGDEILREKLIDIVSKMQTRENAKWTLDKKSVKRLENAKFYGLQMMGKVSTPKEENMTTFDLLVPLGKQLLVLTALMPENPDPNIVSDIDNIFQSLKLKVQIEL